MEVLHRDLPGAAAAAAACLRRHLVCAPAERLELDLVLVLGVARLAGDPVDLQEVVDCHCSPPGAEDVLPAATAALTLPRAGARVTRSGRAGVSSGACAASRRAAAAAEARRRAASRSSHRTAALRRVRRPSRHSSSTTTSPR